jgi:hypothetical protein
MIVVDTFALGVFLVDLPSSMRTPSSALNPQRIFSRNMRWREILTAVMMIFFDRSCFVLLNQSIAFAERPKVSLYRRPHRSLLQEIHDNRTELWRRCQENSDLYDIKDWIGKYSGHFMNTRKQISVSVDIEEHQILLGSQRFVRF